MLKSHCRLNKSESLGISTLKHSFWVILLVPSENACSKLREQDLGLLLPSPQHLAQHCTDHGTQLCSWSLGCAPAEGLGQVALAQSAGAPLTWDAFLQHWELPWPGLAALQSASRPPLRAKGQAPQTVSLHLMQPPGRWGPH